jgi:methylmalonyl-CoA epimerase
MFTRIRAIHIAVNSVEEATKDFAKRFGLEVTRSGEMPAVGIRNAFMPVGDTILEFLEPLDPSQGKVTKFLQTRGEGVYMMAWEVEDLEKAIKELQAKGVSLINVEPEARKKGSPVFIHPEFAHGIMIELIEKPK